MGVRRSPRKPEVVISCECGKRLCVQHRLLYIECECGLTWSYPAYHTFDERSVYHENGDVSRDISIVVYGSYDKPETTIDEK